jgi:mRNA interferase MazF
MWTRADVFRARLDPAEGSEQAVTSRPVVVVSRDAINRFSPVVIVVPATSHANIPRPYPSQVLVRRGTGGFTSDSVLMCEQVRAISKTRLVKNIGRLPPEIMAKVDAALKVALDLV